MNASNDGVPIPLSRRRLCRHCAAIVDGNGSDIHRMVEAWIPCARTKRSDSHTYLTARDLDIYMCADCYDKLRRGISLGQARLFDGT